MTHEELQILNILNRLHPSEAIRINERIGKWLRKKNSIRINAGAPIKVDDRPDLLTLKEK